MIMNSDQNRTTYFPLSIQFSASAWKDLDLSSLDFRTAPSRHYPIMKLADALQKKKPGRPTTAGQLNLLGLLNTTFRLMAESYLGKRHCRIGLDRLEIAERPISLSGLAPAMEGFVRLYPPSAVREGKTFEDFLRGDGGSGNRNLTIVELFVLATQMSNPAAADAVELFDDSDLRRFCPYQRLLSEIDEHLRDKAIPGLMGRSLFEILAMPIQNSPNSLSGQLDYIRRNWSDFLPPELLQGIQTGLDILKEEQVMRGFEPGPIPVPRFGPRATDFSYEEPERFSPDADWMSNVVLIAKTIYVWLHQLTERYGRPITRLDQIPDEELDTLGRWGFTGLWLIGIFERSPASQKIKQIMGNPEAVSSAYSLYDYVVARDLGGEEALADLRERCSRRGIRLGCDVVPNHTGIYSRWTREHPDWFVQMDYPPYPSYRFSGADLSEDSNLGIYIEDGYWNHTDAAVVFKHVDRRSGRERFIYHGNDGTHLPWNDTAQLNFLIPEVREAMIRTILHVARTFRIIRFDAAMTLAKKHYQRLWFPQPGGAAGVPSRAEHSMSREEFERVFPEEFWREVVDRVAAEVPDTLLLAEAFWLMEGYFVRTLGMHRVYNSAFMNMLKTEDNAKYRSVLKNILDFNPEIIKRFVNFMNNPDEATAVEQFGTGDKFFGVSVLLVTMPGLPMFGHGQVEGLREKYGMEFRRPYWDEKIDEAMVRHHVNQIFPLMRRRHLFSGSEQFVLYDFQTGDHVNEDVFAYSNRWGEERTLVIYNNSPGATEGFIGESVPKMIKDSSGGQTTIRPNMGEALDFRQDEGRIYYRFRDYRTGMEYLRHGRDLRNNGFHLSLGPYQYYTFLDFREIFDEEGLWREICNTLQGRPVENLDLEWKKRKYAPLLDSFRRTVSPERLEKMGRAIHLPESRWKKSAEVFDFLETAGKFYRELKVFARADEEIRPLEKGLREDLEAIRLLAGMKSRSRREREAIARWREGLPPRADDKIGGQDRFLRIVLPWALLRRIGELGGTDEVPERSAEWMEEFLLSFVLQEILGSAEAPFHLPDWEAAGEVLLVETLVRNQRSATTSPESLEDALPEMFRDSRVQLFLGSNWHNGILWFNKERLETITFWRFFTSIVTALPIEKEEAERLEYLTEECAYLSGILDAAERSGYQMEKFINSLP